MILLRQLVFALLLLPLLCQISFADTLYQRSLTHFKAKALKAKRNDYTFVVLGDSRDGDEVFKKALRLAKSYDPLFILHGGDYSDRGGEAETAHFLSLVEETAPEMPLFVVIGNHENRGVFARKIGPSHFTLRSKRLGLDLVAVDNAGNVLQPTELDYLRRELSAPAGARFVAMHVPPKTDRWTWHTFTEGAQDLMSILANANVDGVFFSHVHLFDSSVFGGVPAFITGGAGAPLVTMGYPGDPVFHILLVRVKDGKPTFTKVPIPL